MGGIGGGRGEFAKHRRESRAPGRVETPVPTRREGLRPGPRKGSVQEEAASKEVSPEGRTPTDLSVLEGRAPTWTLVAQLQFLRRAECQVLH